MAASPTPPAESSKWLDLGFKLLSTLIIPTFMVGISLYTDAQVQKERIAQVQQHLAESDAQVAALTNRLNQAITTMQETNGELREVRVILGIIRERVDQRTTTRNR